MSKVDVDLADKQVQPDILESKENSTSQLENFDQTSKVVSSRGVKTSDEIRPYNFHRPDNFDRNHLRTLQLVFETFARLAGSIFSTTLRTAVRLKLNSLDQISWGDFSSSVQDPAYLSVFSMPPLPGPAVCLFPQSFSMTIVDMRLGGTGSKDYPNRPLTEIEIGLVSTLSTWVLDQLKEAFSPLTTIEIEITQHETNSQFLQLAPSNDMCLVARLEVNMNEARQFQIAVCIPFNTLRPLLDILTANASSKTNNKMRSAKDSLLASKLSKTSVRVSAVFNPVRLTSDEILHLQPGDVITLNHSQQKPLSLVVGGMPYLKVVPTKQGKKLACLIVEENKNDNSI